ncbi:hypothetical protein [uncultured Microbacterium sp.]|uniref:hypothetical protein n=1 Tax=uncultured Microbacterium sp. TaxID=191216 RepID=UPI0025CD9BFD|nr:hypothetical protein [uncultured Microbacterium sp.]
MLTSSIGYALGALPPHDLAKQMGHIMKTTIIRTVAAISLAAAALLVPATANAYTDPAVVIATPAVVTPGGQTTFTTNTAPFQGDEEVLISVTGVNANGVTLASVVQTNNSLRTKAVNGKLIVPLRLPANAAGTYNLTLTGTRSGTVLHSTITVTGSASTPAKGGLAITGFDAGSTAGLWIAGGGLVVAGGAVAVGALVRRRRAAANT